MTEQGLPTKDPKELLCASGVAAVGVLVSLMQDSNLKPELRLKAAESILDRSAGNTGGLGVGGGDLQGTVSFEGVLEEWSR